VVYYGIKALKHVGEAGLEKVYEAFRISEEFLGKKVWEFTWLETLLLVLPIIRSDTTQSLIAAGLFDNYGLSRKKMLHEFAQAQSLTDREKEVLKGLSGNSLVELLTEFCALTPKEGGPNKARKIKIESIITLLDNPVYNMDDSPAYVYTQEKEFIGESLSYAAVETASTDMQADTTCREFSGGKNAETMSFIVHVDRTKEYKITKGQARGETMLFVDMSDETGKMSGAMFSNTYKEYGDLVSQGSIVCIIGSRSRKGDSLEIKKILEI
jgi:DNA polymerase III alpha subunit